MSRSVLGPATRAWVGKVAEPCYPAIAVVAQRVLFRIGTDVTDDAAGRRCLVLAPHADDETLGAGATIMRKVDAGTPVHLVVVTDGSKSPAGDPVEVARLRAAELRAACGVLGLTDSDVTQLAFVDAELDRAGGALADAIGAVVAAWQPAEVLVTSDTDPHEDHAALGAAARRALAGTAIRVLSYPVWQFERPARLLRLARRSGPAELVRTEGYLERKRRAIAAYPSQLAARDDDPEGLHPSFLRHFVGRYELFFPVDGTIP